MGSINLTNFDILLAMWAALALSAVVVCGWVSRQQKGMQKSMMEALKLQGSTNHQLGQILNEIRRSNRLLTELNSTDPLDAYDDNHSVPLSNLTPIVAQETLEPQHKLYVGNIDYSASESELADFFAQFGQVEGVNIPVNRYTGKARGFGFVTFVAKEDAERAMALHGAEFKGRQIQVNFAKEREIA